MLVWIGLWWLGWAAASWLAVSGLGQAEMDWTLSVRVGLCMVNLSLGCGAGGRLQSSFQLALRLVNLLCVSCVMG